MATAHNAVDTSREDPLTGFHFQVEVQGIITGYFTEVSGLGSENEVIEHKVINEKGTEVVMKIPGRLKWENIVLKRGITSNMDIWAWRKLVEDGIGAHANSVIVYDLPKGAKRFKARGVLDDGGTVRAGMEKTPTSVRFVVFNEAGGTQAADTYVKKSSDPGRDASEAVESLEIHPDLAVQLFASEPMITSPSCTLP